MDAGGAGDGAAAGGLARAAGGAREVAAAGGGAAVCASAPETKRGSAASAPANKTRSVMRQDPTRGETRFTCAPNRFTMHIKVTNLSPARNIAALALAFGPLRCLRPKSKGRPEGRPLGGLMRFWLSLDAG